MSKVASKLLATTFIRSIILGYPVRRTVSGGDLRRNNNNNGTISQGFAENDKKNGVDLFLFHLEISYTVKQYIPTQLTGKKASGKSQGNKVTNKVTENVFP